MRQIYERMSVLVVMAAVALPTELRAADATTEPTTAPAVLAVSQEPGAPYATITEALEAAPDGATIRIGPGVYEERLTIRKPVRLVGAGPGRTTIRIPNRRQEIYDQAVADAEKSIRAGQTDAQLRDALAKLREQFAVPGLKLEGAAGAELSDLKITAQVPTLPENGRIYALGSLLRVQDAKLRVTQCMIVGGPGNGIVVAGGANVSVDHCLVAAVWGTGIVVGSGRQSDAKPAVAGITDCDVRNCNYAGIVTGGRDDATIERCRISGAAWHGIRYGGSPVVRNNIIWGNARCGIYADASKDGATVEGNLFYKNEWTGIACFDLNVDRIVANTFAYNGREALEAIGGAKPTVERNIFFANETAIRCASYNGRSPTAALPGDPRLEDNLFWQHKSTFQKPTEAQPAQANGLPAMKEVELEPSTGSVKADPKFKDPGHVDFSIPPDSPAAKLKAGATNLPAFQSPWPITEEEKAIIPDGASRQYDLWKRPSGDQR
jgi:parallel beta-helix repeat protein